MTDVRKKMAIRATAACGALLLIGCHSSSTPTAMDKPAGSPATQQSMPMVTADQGKPPLPPGPAKPDPKSMTHVLTKEEPYFESMPGADAKSIGKLTKGSKVLLMVPGSTYSKVLTDEGLEVYTVTDGLDPIPAGK
jgi:hypothetical protein